ARLPGYRHQQERDAQRRAAAAQGRTEPRLGAAQGTQPALSGRVDRAAARQAQQDSQQRRVPFFDERLIPPWEKSASFPTRSRTRSRPEKWSNGRLPSSKSFLKTHSMPARPGCKSKLTPEDGVSYEFRTTAVACCATMPCSPLSATPPVS